MNGLAKRFAGAAAVAVVMLVPIGIEAQAQELPGRAAALDTNKNGVIDRDEARGPLASSFDTIDRDKSGGIDGAELAAFFGGGGNGTAVVADSVVEQDLSQTTPVIGQLVARQVGPVSARVSGPVEAVRVQVGDRVKKGDVLVVISADRLQSDSDRNLAIVEQKQAMVVIAEAELEKVIQERQRIDNLRESSAFSQKRRDDVIQDVAMKQGSLANRNAELAQAVEQLNRASIDLRDAEVRAPYDGVVTAKNTEVGAYISVGTGVVTLINQETLEIEVQVPTNRLAGLQRGADVAIALDDGTRHTAVVRAVVPEENPLTRTRAVRLTPTLRDVLKPPALNQSVTVDVPIGGVRQGGHGAQRCDYAGRRAALWYSSLTAVVVAERPVVLGEGVGQRFAVISGLRAGEQVVVRGNEQLSSGDAVRVVSQVGSGSAAQRTN